MTALYIALKPEHHFGERYIPRTAFDGTPQRVDGTWNELTMFHHLLDKAAPIFCEEEERFGAV